MASLTQCTCTLNVFDQTGTAYSTAELVFETRKSQVHSGDGIYLDKPIRTTAVAGVCTMVLAETTTDSQQGVFTLNWNDGSNYNTIVFDPVYIPNQSSVDLSTLLTVARG